MAKKKKTTKKKTTKKRVAAKPRKGGGQTKYKKSYPARAIGYAEDGSFKPSTLAKKFGVSITTILNWLEKYPAFAAAVKKGKDIAVDVIEQMYFQLAKGGLERTKTKTKPGEDGKDIESAITETLFPNERACNKILTTHRPDEYKDKLDVEIPDKITVEVVNYGSSNKNNSPP